MKKLIIKELSEHAPFTIFGALTGIFIMVLLQRLPQSITLNIFYTLHPIHIFLSAMVVTSMYILHNKVCLNSKSNLFYMLAIGYLGSVGLATLSDSLIPFWAETILNMPQRELHIGFLEKWWIINPIAIAAIIFAYFRPSTKIRHSAHVLVSTWASLFHLITAGVGNLSICSYLVIFSFLFVAVWLPCCFGDIVFPLLFIKDKDHRLTCHH